MTPDAARLAEIRRRLSAISPAAWSLVFGDDRAFVEARGLMGDRNELARFHPGATFDEMQFVADAPDTIGFLLCLVDRAIRKMTPRREEPPQHDPKNYAAEAAMRCKDPAFKAFLEQCHGLERPLTDERVSQKVRGMLGVQSRRDLNTSELAGERWKALRSQFENWKRTGQ